MTVQSPGPAAGPVMHAAQIDGVPVLWVPADGPLRARLSFRLGTADETLVCFGLTRLAAHAAAQSLLGLTAAHRVTVAETRTCFDVAGSPDEVVTALAALTASLGAIRADRVDSERARLRIEGAPVVRETGIGRMRELDRLRFGPRTFGLTGCPEFGLQWLAAGHVAAWARDCCTTGNAVLWLSGPPPAGLRLALPDGPRMVPPMAGFGAIMQPTWLTGPGPDVAMSALGLAGFPLEAGVWWLRERLTARLRRVEALKFQVAAATGWLGDGLSRLAVVVEGPPGVGPWVRDDLLHALDEVVSEPVPAPEMDRWARHTHATAFSAGILARLDAAARAELLGEPDLAAQATPAQLTAVGGESARAAVAQCLGSALLRLPDGVTMEDPRWHRLPRLTQALGLDGRTFLPVEPAPAGSPRLVVGADGVMLASHEGQQAVRWVACEAVVAWPDGRRLLVGGDDSRVAVDPRQWADGLEAIAAIDAATPPERLVVMTPDPVDPRRQAAAEAAAAVATVAPQAPEQAVAQPDPAEVTAAAQMQAVADAEAGVAPAATPAGNGSSNGHSGGGLRRVLERGWRSRRSEDRVPTN